MMMTERPFKLFSGIAYPNVLPGDNPTRAIQADLNDPARNYYHDPAIKLSRADLERIGSLSGKPICFEHKKDIVVGQIQRAWCDEKHNLRINAKIWLDTKPGRLAWENLQNGKVAELSVGYNSVTEDIHGQTHVMGKVFDEVSVVRRGFFPGAT
jgi:Caudovirus prohead serine protease